MSDTLKIYGNTYTGIDSIKAEDPNGNELTYIRPQGTKSISQNGTGIDVAEYATVDVNVSGGGGSSTLQAKTNITPTESSQTITADTGYDGLSSVQINAVSSSYVGSSIARRSSSDVDAGPEAGEYRVIIPSGYYESSITKYAPGGSIGTPSAIKEAVSNHSISITPSVNYNAGYIGSTGTRTGTAVTVTASELASGNKAISSNGTGIDVVGYSTVSVAVPQLDTSDATAVAGDIVSGKSAYVNGSKVNGSLVIQHYYTGSSAPSSSLGSDGDIYLQTEG